MFKVQQSRRVLNGLGFTKMDPKINARSRVSSDCLNPVGNGWFPSGGIVDFTLEGWVCI